MARAPVNKGQGVERNGCVTVEFFGMPRHRAGRADLAAPAGTLSQLLRCVERACPQLKDLCQADGGLSPHYLLSINGAPFVTDLRHEVQPGDHLLLLSADAGG
ncbi:MAG TPA: MoaD/ThiS family protein [Gemmataceae bacterium]|nr:MoaD/ThiS family protein [Gemmataceae bacterium]